MLKGQYFSFDAIIATVIMVIAITSLVGYWFGTQLVMESRSNPMYSDSLRIAESLLSPGVPSNWTDESSLANVRQFGLTDGYTNQLNWTKLHRLETWANISNSNYASAGRIMRATGQYCILLEYTENNHLVSQMGNCDYDSQGKEVVVAHRGAVINNPGGKPSPVRLRVFLWR